MRRSWITTLLLVALFAGLFATAVRIQHEGVTKIKGNPPFYETWQLQGGRSSEMLKVVSLQYDQLVADLLWLRAIQSFGGRGMTNRDWRPIYNLFDTITDLDPYFEPAYTFGNLVIGDEGDQQYEGLKLLHKGTFKIFKAYRIPFEGMYVAHWSMSEPDIARWYGRIASKRMDAPDWVERMTAYIDVKSGEYYIGFGRFLGNLLRSLDEQQPPMQAIALGKLMETVEKWNESLLSRAVDEYTSRTGTRPVRIEDLADMPALQNYETVDLARTLTEVQRYTKALKKETGLNPEFLWEAPSLVPAIEAGEAAETPQTTARLMAELQDQIFQSILVTRSGIPEDPYGQGYVLNRTKLADPDADPADHFMRRKQAEEYLRDRLLPDLREAIAERKEELGRNPRDLREVFYTDFVTPEPFGGEWKYDPETGELKSTSHPEF